MKLLVGLGNPGKEYEQTRHNVGFMFIDYLTKRFKKYDLRIKNKKEYILCEVWEGQDKIFELVTPQLFMNKSGEALLSLHHKSLFINPNFIVVHDDLDIPLGMWKQQIGTGPKLHYGIQSIEEHLGTKEFMRIRIGVDNRGEVRIPGEAYVLQKFTEEEKQKLEKIFEEIVIRNKWE